MWFPHVSSHTSASNRASALGQPKLSKFTEGIPNRFSRERSRFPPLYASIDFLVFLTLYFCFSTTRYVHFEKTHFTDLSLHTINKNHVLCISYVLSDAHYGNEPEAYVTPSFD